MLQTALSVKNRTLAGKHLREIVTSPLSIGSQNTYINLAGLRTGYGDKRSV